MAHPDRTDPQAIAAAFRLLFACHFMKSPTVTPAPKGPLPHRRWSAPKYPPTQHRQLKKKKGPYDAP